MKGFYGLYRLPVNGEGAGGNRGGFKVLPLFV